MDRMCERCGTSFKIKPSKVALAERKGFKLYCSQACSAATQRQRPSSAVCERCGEAFAPAPKTAGRFCSRVCVLGSEDNPEARFWARVNKDGPPPLRHPELGNCWVWTGVIEVQGYGRLRIDGKSIKAHRLSFVLHGGELDDDQGALHHCDRRACVRPTHLYAGDHWSNQEDVAEAGTRKGAGNPNARLTEEQVLAIRARLPLEWGEMTEIARTLDVTVQAIFDIVHRKTWTHL